jgi:hypothetical protein
MKKYNFDTEGEEMANQLLEKMNKNLYQNIQYEYYLYKSHIRNAKIFGTCNQELENLVDAKYRIWSTKNKIK